MSRLKIEFEPNNLGDVAYMITNAVEVVTTGTVIKLWVDDFELNFTECKYDGFPNLIINAPDIESVKRFRALIANDKSKGDLKELYIDTWRYIYDLFRDWHNCEKLRNNTPEVATEIINKLQKSPDYIYNWAAQFIVETLNSVRSPNNYLYFVSHGL